MTTIKIFDRIRKLLDLAEHPNTPEHEADRAREKAEHLMREYQVAEEELIAKDPQSLAPISQAMTVTNSREFGNQYFSMLYFICGHMGVQVRATWTYAPNEGSVIQATLVGYESDIRMVEILFTGARMAFSDHLEPKVDPTLSDQVNAYRLRRAGLERNRIAHLLWKAEANDGQAHGRVAKLYKAECETRGETAALSGRGVNAKLYRTEYANAFTHRIWERLRRARDAADRAGGLPALHGREERVKEAFYALFPEERPAPAGSVERRAGKTKAAKPWKPTKADERAWARAQRPEARAARGAGSAAADTVKIDGSDPTQRLDDRTADERETTRQVRGALG